MINSDHITHSGNVSESDLSGLTFVESIFFSARKAQPKPQHESKELKTVRPSTAEPTESTDPAEQPQTTPTNNEPEASQVFLREVGHSLEGSFLGVGSRYIRKAARKCYVVYLEISGERCFLSGTQLQEAIVDDVSLGDSIRITKTGQYRRAHDREHAKAATFKVEKI
ncbi:hypothetical protein [Thalassolituus marinus]|uniref:Uncharacterized protein n=1 Tax=Thalassolituus marinus TaxID=671053 RepID=A0ABS7ZUH3_9GAMM|nr:hypothetical protein [Thalassolituus marinus]MCA6065407.1 hypothetical protein [Thalassolituus marinus]